VLRAVSGRPDFFHLGPGGSTRRPSTSVSLHRSPALTRPMDELDDLRDFGDLVAQRWRATLKWLALLVWGDAAKT
jgi:hypothetical protein